MINIDFIITSLIVILIPGTGAIFTISISLFKNKKEGIAAAFGCTIGIIPHLLVSMISFFTIFIFNSSFFYLIKYLGIIYLVYLAYSLFNDKGILKIENKNVSSSIIEIIVKGVLINLLNPKLSIFFLSFLPQFLDNEKEIEIKNFLVLSSFFMLMTFLVFIFYSVLANYAKEYLFESKENLKNIQKLFAILFSFFAFKLLFFN